MIHILMANESECLLPFEEERHVLGYRNKSSTSSDADHDITAAVTVIKEQADLLKELKKKLNVEQEKNLSLSYKVEAMHVEHEKLMRNYSKEIAERSDEIENLKTSLEAQSEFQASIIDELKFQIQSLRNKMENNRSSIIENGNMSSIVLPVKLSKSPKLPIRELGQKHFLRHSDENSCSTGSNPCLVSQPNVVHRAEIIWRINAFTKKLKRIRSGSYDDPSRSEPFMTGPFGYRLSGWAYLNGRGKGQDNYLSLYIRVMAGEYDPILHWPIKPCYTFYLLNQDPHTNKRMDLVRVRDLSLKHSGICRPKRDDKSIIVGFDDFIMHEDIEKKNYSVDDSIFVKFVAEIPSIS